MAAASVAKNRIMLIGDSITEGYFWSSNYLGYRYDLYKLIDESGWPFEFVGSMGDAPYQGHFYSGSVIRQFYPGWTGMYDADVSPDMDQWRPNVVVIHLGTNDMWDYQIGPYSNDGGATFDSNTVSGRMAVLLSTLCQWKTGERGNNLQVILLSQIIPKSGSEEWQNDRVLEFNRQLALIAEDSKTGRLPSIPPGTVRLVDQYTGFDAAAMMGQDGIHPNDLGYTRMAGVFWRALKTLPMHLAADKTELEGSSRLPLGPVVAEVTDGFGSPVPRVPVRFLIDSGNAALMEPDTVETDSLGFARAWIRPNAPGVSTIRAEADNLIESSVVYTVTASVPLAAKFGIAPQTGMIPLSVQFSDSSTGPVTAWKWFFGDGDSSLTQNPAHVYVRPDSFNVTLIVSNQFDSDTVTVKNGVVTAHPLKAKFDRSPHSGAIPLSVQFSDSSTGPVTAWKWFFGDGDSSSAQNPTHVYDRPDSFNVTLIVSNPFDSDTMTINKGVIAIDAMVAGFSITPQTGTVPLSVQFIDNSVGQAWAWKWYFGDGDSSTVQNPIHVYTKADTFDVTLIVSSRYNSDTLTVKKDVITVHPLTAKIDLSPHSGAIPLSVQFSDSSIGPVTAWKWFFGDGDSSLAQNPIHVYNRPDSFNVTLIASNQFDSDTVTVKNDVVAVLPNGVREFTLPKAFAFHPPFPNPFNLETHLRFDLPKSSELNLVVFDLNGQKTADLYEGRMEAGYHDMIWNGANLPSGVYFIRLKSDSYQQVRKVLLVK